VFKDKSGRKKMMREINYSRLLRTDQNEMIKVVNETILDADLPYVYMNNL
jgi:hypothetical protein